MFQSYSVEVFKRVPLYMQVKDGAKNIFNKEDDTNEH